MHLGGKIEHTLMKRKRRQPMVPQTSLHLIAKHGIEGDINANPASPRQVLLIAGETLDKFRLHPGKLRENIVTRHLDHTILRSGCLLKIGDSTVIRITFSCETCKHIGPFPFKLRELETERGFLGVVLQGGVISPDDPVELLPEKYPEIPDTLYQRFLWLVEQIPHGKVMTYKQLMHTIGGSSSYNRAIPGYIKRAAASTPHLPLHRLLNSQGCLIPYIPQQDELLRGEGIVIKQAQINTTDYYWNTETLYFQHTLQDQTVPKEHQYVT